MTDIVERLRTDKTELQLAVNKGLSEIMALRTAAQAALEALKSLQGGCTDHNDGTVEALTVWCSEIVDALRAALASKPAPVSIAGAADTSHITWDEQGRRIVNGITDEPATVAGMETVEPVAWHVCSVNSDGALSLEFAAPWEELAHEHINDAINDDIDGAASWVVRPVYASPRPTQTEPSPASPLDECQYAKDVDMPEYRCVGKCQYAATQQRQPLTQQEIWTAVSDALADNHVRLRDIVSLARAVEAAHDIKEQP